MEKLTTTFSQRRNDTGATYIDPYYELGVFVYLSNHIKEVQIDVFARGEKQAILSFKDI